MILYNGKPRPPKKKRRIVNLKKKTHTNQRNETKYNQKTC